MKRTTIARELEIMNKRWNSLSDEAKEHIKEYGHYHRADRFYVAVINYMLNIEHRFYTGDNDEEDYLTLKQMIGWLNFHKDNIAEFNEYLEPKKSTIVIDD